MNVLTCREFHSLNTPSLSVGPGGLAGAMTLLQTRASLSEWKLVRDWWADVFFASEPDVFSYTDRLSLCCALIKIFSHWHLDSVEVQAANIPLWMLLLLMCNVQLFVSGSAASGPQTIIFSIWGRWRWTNVLYWEKNTFLESCLPFIYLRLNKRCL